MFTDEQIAQMLRDGTIKLRAPSLDDRPEVRAWLEACQRIITEEYERKSGAGHA